MIDLSAELLEDRGSPDLLLHRNHHVTRDSDECRPITGLGHRLPPE
jgi:hypothetical protein